MVGQHAFLVSAGTRGERMLRTMPGVRVLLDSGAWPIVNPQRVTREQFWWIVRWWSRDSRFTYAMSYDHILDPQRSAEDHAWLLAQPWDTEVPPVVRVAHYPTATADDIIGEALHDLADLTSSEIAELQSLRQRGFVVGDPYQPKVAIGGLVPAHGDNESRDWYNALLSDLSSQQAELLDMSERRMHLLGVSKPDWVNHPLVASFDSSTPARMAALGGWKAIAKRYDSAFGISAEKLQRSREARLAYHLIRIRNAVGLPWTRPNECDLLDDKDCQKWQHRNQQANSTMPMMLL